MCIKITLTKRDGNSWDILKMNWNVITKQMREEVKKARAENWKEEERIINKENSFKEGNKERRWAGRSAAND